MNTDKWETDILRQIWNNNTGDRFEIGPDRDGLDFIEIRSYNSENKLETHVSFPLEVAKLVYAALGKFIEEFEEKKKPQVNWSEVFNDEKFQLKLKEYYFFQ
jgi:hypothetical protein